MSKYADNCIFEREIEGISLTLTNEEAVELAKFINVRAIDHDEDKKLLDGIVSDIKIALANRGISFYEETL